MKPEELLDRAVAAVGDETIDSTTERAALDRVRRRLAAETAAETARGAGATADDSRIHGCAGFRELLPAYRAGALTEAKRLLVADHLRECVPCRRAHLDAQRQSAAGLARPQLRGTPPRRWALAASLAGLVTLAGALWLTVGGIGIDAEATVRALDGELFHLSGERVRALGAGDQVAAGDVVRTGAASGAVLELGDGSRVELAERSELRFEAARDGVVAHLARGSVIVEAAAQQRGHLYVETGDCRVAVVGTIFSVRHGDKGSRVSVIEGEVRVAQGTRRAVLRPGDQLSTSARLARVPVGEEFAWSRDAARYREQVAALAALGRELDRALAVPGERTSTRLLDLAPAETRMWAGLPNLSSSLAEAWALVRTRVDENPALAAWWSERFAGQDQESIEAEIELLLQELAGVGEHLGAEIAVAIETRGGDTARPLVLAEVTAPAGFAELLDQEIARWNERIAAEGESAGPRLVRVADPRAAEPLDRRTVALWLSDELLAASPELGALADLAARVDGGERPFVETPFHARLTAAYAEGAGWLFGVDLAALVASEAPGERDRVALERAGLADVEHLILESESVGEATESRATLAFGRERRGVASWLAPPAPVGALEFVSAGAQLAVGGVSKQPAEMLDDLLAVLAAGDDGALAKLADFEAEHGVSLRDDLALALGGDGAFAVDGPLLPTPSWKLVVEVMDRDRLLGAAARLLEAWTRDAAAAGRPPLRFVQESEGGRVFYSLERVGGSRLASFLFADGYLLAGPSKALLVEAVALRAAGATLPASAAFREQLPRDGRVDYSAVAWQNMGGSLAAVGSLLGGVLSEAEREPLTELAGEVGPSLVVVYADPDRLTFVLAGTRGPLGLSFERLFAWAGRPGPAAAAERAPASARRDETRPRRAA